MNAFSIHTISQGKSSYELPFRPSINCKTVYGIPAAFVVASCVPYLLADKREINADDEAHGHGIS